MLFKKFNPEVIENKEVSIVRSNYGIERFDLKNTEFLKSNFKHNVSIVNKMVNWFELFLGYGEPAYLNMSMSFPINIAYIENLMPDKYQLKSKLEKLDFIRVAYIGSENWTFDIRLNKETDDNKLQEYKEKINNTVKEFWIEKANAMLGIMQGKKPFAILVAKKISGSETSETVAEKYPVYVDIEKTTNIPQFKIEGLPDELKDIEEIINEETLSSWKKFIDLGISFLPLNYHINRMKVAKFLLNHFFDG